MGCTSCGGSSSPIRQGARSRRSRGQKVASKAVKSIVYNDRVHGGYEALRPIKPVITPEPVEEEVTSPQEEVVEEDVTP